MLCRWSHLALSFRHLTAKFPPNLRKSNSSIPNQNANEAIPKEYPNLTQALIGPTNRSMLQIKMRTPTSATIEIETIVMNGRLDPITTFVSGNRKTKLTARQIAVPYKPTIISSEFPELRIAILPATRPVAVSKLIMPICEFADFATTSNRIFQPRKCLAAAKGVAKARTMIGSILAMSSKTDNPGKANK